MKEKEANVSSPGPVFQRLFVETRRPHTKHKYVKRAKPHKIIKETFSNNDKKEPKEAFFCRVLGKAARREEAGAREIQKKETAQETSEC